MAIRGVEALKDFYRSLVERYWVSRQGDEGGDTDRRCLYDCFQVEGGLPCLSEAARTVDNYGSQGGEKGKEFLVFPAELLLSFRPGQADATKASPLVTNGGGQEGTCGQRTGVGEAFCSGAAGEVGNPLRF